MRRGPLLATRSQEEFNEDTCTRALRHTARLRPRTRLHGRLRRRRHPVVGVRERPEFRRSFASVINNTSGDPFAIVMTPEPVTPVAAPVASYAVSGIPTTGQAVTFTDTSTNAPTSQFWAFGDGTTATSGATVQHTFAAAATYRTTHFVSNAGGTSAAVKDVV